MSLTCSSSFNPQIIGYAIVGVTFSMQPVMRWACEKLEGFWRIIVADIFLFVSFVGTVNGKIIFRVRVIKVNYILCPTVWRGIWALLDNYFLPGKPIAPSVIPIIINFLFIILDDKLLSDWLTHGVSLVLLILLNCSNSVLVRGVYIDAEEPAGQCVIFPVYYIRLFFQKERTKKQQRLMEKLEQIDQNNTVLLIEKPQLNHATSVTIVKKTSLPIAKEDFKLNEFSESDKSNVEIDENGEHKILCDGE